MDLPSLKTELTMMTLQMVNHFHDMSMKNLEDWKKEFSLEIVNMSTKGNMIITKDIQENLKKISEKVDTLQMVCQAQDGRLQKVEAHCQQLPAIGQAVHAQAEFLRDKVTPFMAKQNCPQSKDFFQEGG